MIPIITLAVVLGLPVWSHATTYYIAPTGSNSNNGLSTGAPFLTFAHAINAARAWCGDTLVLVDGTYGDGTSTGRLDINGVACTSGLELVVRSLNERKAKIQGTTGSGKIIWIRDSDYIIVDGLYSTGADNAGVTSSENGMPIQVRSSQHVTVRNSVFNNTNRYGNNALMGAYFSQDILFEDNEGYTYNRHCLTAWHSARVVVRRQYCNPRDGMPAGGVGPGVGLADAVMSMYPCRDCILENSISDGVTGQNYLAELNPTFGSGILLDNSKVLGSICIRCRSNGIFIDERGTGLNYVTHNAVVRDVAFVDYTSASSAVRISDAVNALIEHVTIDGVDGAEDAITADDQDAGTTGVDQSITIRNVSVRDVDRAYHRETGSYTGSWLATNVNAFSSATNFSGSPWTNTTTLDPGYGTCKGLWPVDGSNMKGAGTGGSDIGATILYRYVDGVLTTTPLWDPTTGEFPHGDATADGINRVAGESLYDVHTRLNVNTGGCAFPSSFTSPGGGGGGGGAPTNPANIVSSTDLTGPHVHTISSASNRGLTVAVDVIWNSSGSPVYATGVTSSCGGTISAASPAELYTGTTSGHRSLRIFTALTPNSGTCTLTPTFSGAISGGWAMVSVEESNIGSYGTVSIGIGSSTAPSLTSVANADERIRDFLAARTGVSMSAGTYQTLTTDAQHGSVSLRLASSEQDGADGQLVSYVLGGVSAWAMATVPIVPPAPGGPGSSTFRISNYRIYSLHGSSATPEISMGALAAQNTAAEIGATGEFRLRAEIIAENDTSVMTGIHPYCKKAGGSFALVGNSFGSGFVRYYGAGAEPTIPASLTATTRQLPSPDGASFVAGHTSRSSELAVTLPVMAATASTEIDYQFAAGNGLVAGDVLECEIRRDDGSTLGTHTNPMQINIVGPRASFGF